MRAARQITTITALALASALAMGGCALRSAPSEFYTLSALSSGESNAQTAREDLAIGIGPVSFPEFLDRPQIVTRSSPHRLELDEFHRWGGSLRADFVSVLGDNLSTLLGTSRIVVYPTDPPFKLTHSILLAVQTYEGTLGKGASLVVRWAVVEGQNGRALLVRQSRITETVSSADHEALVAAQSRALAALSHEIAAAISGLAEPRKR
ncbi:MAG: PqiC family protein [Gammaproteobacteria bacterium]|nr:PqiC family protein [Gammaproteobacteria bacterium]